MDDSRDPNDSTSSNNGEIKNPFSSPMDQQVAPPTEDGVFQPPQTTSAPQNPFGAPQQYGSTPTATSPVAAFDAGVSFKQLPAIFKRTWKLSLIHLAISVVAVFILSFITTKLLQGILGEPDQFEQNPPSLGSLMMVYLVMGLIWSVFAMVILTLQANAAHKAMAEEKLAISDGFSFRHVGTIIGLGLAVSVLSVVLSFTIVGPLIVAVLFYFTVAVLVENPDASVGDSVKTAFQTLKNNPVEAVKSAGLVIVISLLAITVIGGILIGIFTSALAIASVRQTRQQSLPVAA